MKQKLNDNLYKKIEKKQNYSLKSKKVKKVYNINKKN